MWRGEDVGRGVGRREVGGCVGKGRVCVEEGEEGRGGGGYVEGGVWSEVYEGRCM